MIAVARSYIGIPYRHQGRTRLGLDCVGLIIAVAHDLHLLPQDFLQNNYGRLPKDELVEKTATYCTQIPAARPGCMALIRWPNERRPGHAAILCGETMIHSYSTHEKVIEHGYRAHWVKWTVSFWALPAVAYG